MSIYPAIFGAVAVPARSNPRWLLGLSTGRINEGEQFTLSLQCSSPLPTAIIQIRFTGGKSGGSDGNWIESWHSVFARVCAAHGCIYVKNGGRDRISGTIRGTVQATDAYQGQEMVFTNRARRNRKTDAKPAFGGPGWREVEILLVNQTDSGATPPITSATVGSGTITGPSTRAYPNPDGSSTAVVRNKIQIMDTSKTPLGTPTMSLRTFAADGVSPSPIALLEGDQFWLELATANMIPGTQVRLVAANEGQYDVRPSVRSGLSAAARAIGMPFDIVNYPLKTGELWYNGITVTFDDDYDDARPLRLLFTVKSDTEDEPAKVFNLFATVEVQGDAVEFEEGVIGVGLWNPDTVYGYANWVTWDGYPDATGAKYVYTAEDASSGHKPDDMEYWRVYTPIAIGVGGVSKTFKDVPRRYWEARATREGGTLYYDFQLPAAAPGASVRVAVGGDVAVAGFVAALAAAADAHPQVAFDPATMRLTALGDGITDDAAALSFSLPSPGGPGKQTIQFVDVQGDAPVVIGYACAFLSPQAKPAGQPANAYGVNLAGAEFDTNSDLNKPANGGTHKLPGVYGVNYSYPDSPPDDHRVMDYYHRKRITLIRLPIKWERVQETLFGPLAGDVTGGPFSGRQDLRRIDAIVDHWTGLGHILSIDLHNYSGYTLGYENGYYEEGRSISGKVSYDSTLGVTPAALADFWIRIARRYEDVPGVALDLMNEPSGTNQGPRRVSDWAQWVVNAIRGETNFRGIIFVEGTAYSSCRNWVANGQAAAFQSLVDPIDNLIFSPHCYFDEQAAGIKDACVIGSEDRLRQITLDARANGYRLMMGEMAGSSESSCQQVLPAAYGYMRANSDVWFGWTTWGGGPRWGASYSYRVDPLDYSVGSNQPDTNALAMMLPYLPA